MAISPRKLYALSTFVCLFLLIHFRFDFKIIIAIIAVVVLIALFDLRKRND